jgi:hypothetical protein
MFPLAFLSFCEEKGLNFVIFYGIARSTAPKELGNIIIKKSDIML